MLLLTHNAYWFQGAPSLWGEEQIRPHPLVLQSLGRLYGELRPDLLCLQEVPGPAAVDELSSTLQMEGLFAPGGLRPGYGGALLWRGCGASVCDLTHTPNRRGEAFERMALRLKLDSSEWRISVLNLHLASNRFAPEGCGEPVRLAELDAALDAAPSCDIVTGDFNAVPDSAVCDRMRARGYADARLEGDRHGRPAAQRIDYIWVRSGAGLAVTAHGVVADERFQVPGHPATALSDHHPLWAQLEPADT